MPLFTKSYRLVLILCLSILLLLGSPKTTLSAEVNNWKEVAKTNTGVQYIDLDTINYDSKGKLLLFTKYSEIDPNDQRIVKTNLYNMEIDCSKRLFRDNAINGNSIKNSKWISPEGDMLLKKTIIKSCTY